MKPLAIDLYCGLGGWTEGLLAEGWDVIGFDIERHRYPARAIPEPELEGIKAPGVNLSGDRKRGIGSAKSGSLNMAAERRLLDSPLTGGWIEYPAQLVIQDVLTLVGSQFRNADLIVASPPCQGYSYRAMPWSRAKALPPPDNSLFDACFRIQREACEASGRHIPLIVENVRGAQKWVGRSRWNFGSFHLWGDVPALMPMTKAIKQPGTRFDGSGKSWQSEAVKIMREGAKMPDGDGVRTDKGRSAALANYDTLRTEISNGKGMLIGGGVHASRTALDPAKHWSGSSARKFASAMIAKIPFALSSYIGRTFYPTERREAA